MQKIVSIARAGMRCEISADEMTLVTHPTIARLSEQRLVHIILETLIYFVDTRARNLDVNLLYCDNVSPHSTEMNFTHHEFYGKADH